jgi:hypothetical protein
MNVSVDRQRHEFICNNVNDDGNKSLYLIFVGVIFLIILDCF